MADDITCRIQTLPQELQDMVLGYTVTPPSATTITVNKFYKPPLGLQLNRKMRQKTAFTFYANNTFLVTPRLRYCERWIESLDGSHLEYFTRVVLSIFKPADMSKTTRGTVSYCYWRWYEGFHLLNRWGESDVLRLQTVERGSGKVRLYKKCPESWNRLERVRQ